MSKFSLLYSETAQRVEFPLSYRFIQQDWINLLSSDKWFLYKLQYESLIAGCVVSFHEIISLTLHSWLTIPILLTHLDY